eukprot:g9228.t1
MGMKNHELVPVELIASIAKLRHGGTHKILSTLLTFKLIAHDRSAYDGYRLTYTGYDILALNVLQARGHICAVGSRIGMGKEADIYMAQTPDGDQVVLKLHRLGRTSFRAVKNKRDYLRSRTSVSWLYMSRLSALKEFAFMTALFQHGFPTPTPLDHNRHVVLMSHAKGYPMYQLRSGEMAHPDVVYRQCVEMIVRLARHGLIHCDFNEFNMLVDDQERLTLIDFPQMVSTRHANAEEMFDRDVACVVKFFSMKMKHVPEASDIPSFADAVGGAGREGVEHQLDVVAQASGFSEKEAKDLDAFVAKEGWGGDDFEADGDVDDDDDNEEEEEEEGVREELDGDDAVSHVERRTTKARAKGDEGDRGGDESGSGTEGDDDGDGGGDAEQEGEDAGVRIRREEPFKLPDVVFCPGPGDGCDSNNGTDCLPMSWRLSALEGFANCDQYFATPSPVVPTPYPLETTAHEWCPRVPLSECDIDHGGIESGGVRSLHASFYVLWDDMVSLEPVSSARRFINVFFVDHDVDVKDAVVAVRLPYDRVNITGTDPFTFSSNDVILSMSQYVNLDSNGKAGATERTYTQATTTAQHTLRLDTFEGETYEGALLYVTLSVNHFAYQSIEEVDPVDIWALLGSAGGMWEIVCVVFGACFVALEVSGPDKKWGWNKKDDKKEDWREKSSKFRGRWHSDVVGGPIPAVATRPSAATTGGTLTDETRGRST